jgi:type IV pilus assembly protein PilW
MSQRIQHTLRLHPQRGLSLIELMIAMSISALLILGLIEIFSSTRSAFAASEALARTQENSRFAMDYLRRDVRMGGHLGCMNEFGHIAVPEQRFHNHTIDVAAALTTAELPYRIDVPVQVYDFDGTEPGESYTIADGEPVPVTSGAGWTPAVPAGNAAGEFNIIDTTANGVGGLIPGSDVIVVRYFDEAPIVLATGPTSASLWPTGQGGVSQTNGWIYVGESATSIVPGVMYGITNCKLASLFQMTANNTGAGIVRSGVAGVNIGRPAGAAFAAQEVYGIGSMMFRYRAVIYYIGRGANRGPSLFRKALSESGPGWGATEEVVEGVESMQILLATADVPTATGRIDDVTGYQSPTALLTGLSEVQRVDALRRVASVRISLLMRSPQAGAGVDPTVTTVVVGDVIITPPLDRRLRHVYDSMIMLRNRQRA